MRNKLSIQNGEEGDEEDIEADPTDKDKQWGKSKKGYYGADTEEYEVRVHVLLTSQFSLISPAWYLVRHDAVVLHGCQVHVCLATQGMSTCDLSTALIAPF